MSLARAFTTRRARQEQPAGRPVYIGRAASQRSPDAKPIVRSQISLPVALISTTNMLSYDAPDIAGTTSVTALETIPSSASSDSGHSSDNESDRSTRSGRSNTLTDMSSIDGDSPATPATPEPNHLSCYFKTKGASISPSVASQTSSDSPIIPQRAASHSKTAHVQLSHKRSMQRMASQKTRESTEMFNINSSIPSPTLTDVLSHPFGKELEQLSEVQEEFNGAVRDAEAEADRLAMASRDLMAFCASDYMAEIFAYYTTAFEEDAATFGCTNWI